VEGHDAGARTPYAACPGGLQVEGVAVPLADMYPQQAWQLLLGYQQGRSMGARAGEAIGMVGPSGCSRPGCRRTS
jgi:hypothetical protein